MMKNVKNFSGWLTFITIILSTALVMPAFAQQRGQRGPSSRNFQLDREGWVQVAYDLNNDGVYETFEYISYYDLERARQHSERKMQQGRQQMSRQQYDRRRQQQFGQRGQQQYDRSRQQQFGQRSRQRQQTDLDLYADYYKTPERITSRIQRGRFEKVDGSIKELKTVKLAGIDERHVIARIQARDNRTAKVDLGPAKRIREMNIRKGQSISVYGKPGTINEKAMLIAHWLNFDGRRVNIRRAQDKNMKFYQGEILKTRTTTFGEQTEDHFMARVRLDNGMTTMVNLGPAKAVQNARIKEGQQFSMLARPVNINGQRALVAEHVAVNDQVFDIDWLMYKNNMSG